MLAWPGSSLSFWESLFIVAGSVTKTTDVPRTGPRSPLRVWRAIARLNVGGPARHVMILNTGLAQRGMTTLLVHGSLNRGENALAGTPDEERLAVEYVAALGRSLSFFQDLRAFLQLLRSMRRFQPDVVHTHTAKAGALGRAAAALYNMPRRRPRRCSVVHTFHGHVFSGYFGPTGSAAARFVERLLARTADAIVVISERQRVDIVERYRIAPSTKVRVIPLGLRLESLLALEPDAPSLRQDLSIPPDAIVFGFMGRFAPIKSLATLIEAFAGVAAKVPRAHLLLVGDGETRGSVEAQAMRSYAASRIHFLGWQTDLPRVLATMDVGVLTSRNEGTPVALIETLAAGRPVVATNVGGVADVVDDGETGLLVSAEDTEAFAAAMLRVAQDSHLRHAMGERGRATVLRFDHRRLTDDIAGLYEQLVAERRAG